MAGNLISVQGKMI